MHATAPDIVPVPQFIEIAVSIQCHLESVAEVLNFESNMECTQLNSKNWMVSDIGNDTMGGKNSEVEEPDKVIVHNVGTIKEQLVSIEFVKIICVSNNASSTEMIPELRNLLGELWTEHNTGLTKTKRALFSNSNNYSVAQKTPD